MWLLSQHFYLLIVRLLHRSPDFAARRLVYFGFDLPNSEEPFQQEPTPWRMMVCPSAEEDAGLALPSPCCLPGHAPYKTRQRDPAAQCRKTQPEREIGLFSWLFQMLRPCNCVPPWGQMSTRESFSTCACRRPIGTSVEEEESEGKRRRFYSFLPVSFALNRILHR